MALLLALGAILLAMLVAAVIAGAGRGGPAPHPEYGPMLQGIDGGTLGAPLWAGYAAGIATIGMMWLMMRIGMRPGHWIHRVITGWTAAYILIFIFLMQSFGGYASGTTGTFLGFATPTAWLVYGIGFAPWIPLLALTLSFENAYAGPEAEARFREILAESGAASRPDA